MAKVIAIGQPANGSEREAIAHLRDHLSSTFTVIHNFELKQSFELYEIDIALLCPHCVFVIDVKVTLKDYRLTPALPSLLVLRRRSDEELKLTSYPDRWVFIAVVDRAGVDAHGKKLFPRAPDGEELVFDDEVIERVGAGGRVESRTVARRQRRVDDELPIVAEWRKGR